jgi:hypothetical protein
MCYAHECHSNGQSPFEEHAHLLKEHHTGGYLPLLAGLEPAIVSALPAIAAGVGALGELGGLAGGIASAVKNSKTADKAGKAADASRAVSEAALAKMLSGSGTGGFLMNPYDNFIVNNELKKHSGKGAHQTGYLPASQPPTTPTASIAQMTTNFFKKTPIIRCYNTPITI